MAEASSDEAELSPDEYRERCVEAYNKYCGEKEGIFVMIRQLLDDKKEGKKSAAPIKYTSLKHLLSRKCKQAYTGEPWLEMVRKTKKSLREAGAEPENFDLTGKPFDESDDELDDRLEEIITELRDYGTWGFCQRNHLTLDEWNDGFLNHYYSEFYLSLVKDPYLAPHVDYMRTTDIQLILSGSLAERTATTFVWDSEMNGADIDLMSCDPLEGKLKDIKTRPGYLRIKNPNSSYHETDDRGYLLSRHSIYDDEDFHKVAERSMKRDGMSYKLSGPALSGVASEDPVEGFKQFDYVFGSHAYGLWPQIASEWIHRERPSGWPSQHLIAKVIKKGFCVVPAAHPASPNPEIEWRYSFSEPELFLMRNLSKKQRKCFMLVKHFCKLIFDGFKLLSTYHIKTTFMWLMEEHPTAAWEMYELRLGFHMLIDKLIEFCAKGNLPNYFIRKANIIDTIPRDHLRTINQKLLQIKTKPWSEFPR